MNPPRVGDPVFVRYRDHVNFHRVAPDMVAPQTRRAVGMLRYACPEYVIVVWDEDDEPPKLKGADAKASGIVILKSDILELRRVG